MVLPLLAVENLSVHFHLKTKQMVQALSGVAFTLQHGECLGIVGESGCGKSTLAKAVLQLVNPSAGCIRWQGEVLPAQDKVRLQAYRRAVQCIFQDPLDALDPRMSVGDSIQEPMLALRPEWGKTVIRERVDTLLQAVGLDVAMHQRYPHEFSGGAMPTGGDCPCVGGWAAVAGV